MTVLLDTNIILEHLRSGILKNVEDDIDFAVSVITEAELLRFAGMDVKEMDAIERFLAITMVVSLDSTIARRAGELGRTRKTKLPDLLIAATALELCVPLITKDLKDFENIPGLDVWNSVPTQE